MSVKQTLTIKPQGFTMYARLREDLDPMSLERRLWGGKEPQRADAKDVRVEEVGHISPDINTARSCSHLDWTNSFPRLPKSKGVQ